MLTFPENNSAQDLIFLHCWSGTNLVITVPADAKLGILLPDGPGQVNLLVGQVDLCEDFFLIVLTCNLY